MKKQLLCIKGFESVLGKEIVEGEVYDVIKEDDSYYYIWSLTGMIASFSKTDRTHLFYYQNNFQLMINGINIVNLTEELTQLSKKYDIYIGGYGYHDIPSPINTSSKADKSDLYWDGKKYVFKSQQGG